MGRSAARKIYSASVTVLLAVLSIGCAREDRLSAISNTPLQFEETEKQFLDELQQREHPSRLTTIRKSIGWHSFVVVDRWSVGNRVFVTRYEAGAEGIEAVSSASVEAAHLSAWYRSMREQVMQQARPAVRAADGTTEVTVHVTGTPHRILYVGRAERIAYDDIGLAVRVAAHVYFDAIEELQPFEIAQLAASAATISPHPAAYSDLLVRLYDALIVTLDHVGSRAEENN